MTARLKALATVHVIDDEAAWVVTETPSEVMERVDEVENHHDFVTLTLGNKSRWNGRPVYIRVDQIRAISPPIDLDDEEDDE